MSHSIPEQLRRRRDAAFRLPPLEAGDRDPLMDSIRRNSTTDMMTSTALTIASIGGTLTQAQYREVWASTDDEDARAMLHAYGHAHHEGWPA